jgi:uncharacterized membrane protein
MPSAWPQRFLIASIASLGIAVALYLGLYQWRIILNPWDPFFGDGTRNVLDSNLSHAITSYVRIPDAVFGIFAYLGDVIFTLAGSNERWRDRPWLVILFGLSTIPLGIVGFLLVLSQAFIVKSYCFLCLLSAAISLSLIPLAYKEVHCSLLYLHELFRLTNFSTTLHAFFGTPHPLSLQISETILKRKYVA